MKRQICPSNVTATDEHNLHSSRGKARHSLTKPTVIGDEVIINNGFFPDIQLSEIRNAMLIDGTVTNERLKHSALDAMQTVNRDLKDFRLKAQTKGKSRLSLCDEEQLNDESELDYLYKRAVFC